MSVNVLKFQWNKTFTDIFLLAGEKKPEGKIIKKQTNLSLKFLFLYKKFHKYE